MVDKKFDEWWKTAGISEQIKYQCYVAFVNGYGLNTTNKDVEDIHKAIDFIYRKLEENEYYNPKHGRPS